MSVPQTEVFIFVDGAEVARHVLGPGAHTFGSSSECSIQIEAEHVSRQHARLTVGEDGSLLLADLGSTNSTLLDGVRIVAPTPVRPNQSIQIGAATLLVQQGTSGIGDDDSIPRELTHAIRYEPGAEIAKGGMGAILAARQPAIRREVALKVMLRNASGHDRLRFIEEAQITGQLEHPNIVPVHDLALNEHGQPYYTMKLVRGGTLRDVLKLLAASDPATVAKYSLAALVTTFQKICDAVAFAHAKGVIHRDLKPANIMVGEFGEVLVMDWGLAKVLRKLEVGTRNDDGSPPAEQSAIRNPQFAIPPVSSAREDQREVFATLDGAVMGTPQYMSPEQALGEIATLDQRSDIFSLGAILYELVTLVPPFSGKTTREILARIKDGDCLLPNARLRAAGESRPRHLRGGAIPDSLEAVIMKALALDRDRRYQRVEEFQADLTAYQNGFATGAENAGARTHLALFIKRHQAVSIAAAAGVALLTLVSAGFTVRVIRERNLAVASEKRAEQSRGIAEAQTAIAEERSKEVSEKNAENKKQLHDASMADYSVAVQRIEKDDRWREGVAHLARALQWEPANALAAMRLYNTLAFYAPNKTNRLRQVLLHDEDVRSARFSPDGTRIVTASADKSARVWDAATGKPMGEPMLHDRDELTARFSPDGSRILTESTDLPTGGPERLPSEVRVWDADTCKPLGAPMANSRTASFSPVGTRMVTITDDKTVRVWDSITGAPVGEPMRHKERVECATFSPDGTRIVTGTSDYREKQETQSGETQIWDASSGKPLGKPIKHNWMVSSASFSPDGKRIVTASGATLRVWDAATGKPLTEPMEHEYGVALVIFSPDGTRIFTSSGSHHLGIGNIRVWDSATGKLLVGPIHIDFPLWNASFSPDGRWIVAGSGDEAAQVWDVTTGERVGEPMEKVYMAVFSPDGMRIITATADGKTAHVWDAPASKPLGEPLRHKEDVYSASFSLDGMRIVTTTRAVQFNRASREAAHIWDVASGKRLGEPMRGESPEEDSFFASSASFSPDGTRIVTANSDNTARVWDANTGKPVGEPMRHDDRVESASFSPDGKQILTVANDVRLWDAATLKPLVDAPVFAGASSASFSPDGTRILTAHDTAKVWDAATGRLLSETAKQDNWPFHAAFSPDGKRVVTLSGQIVQMWDANTGKPIGEPISGEGSVNSVNFNSDGKWILTANSDYNARLWDAATGKPVGEPLRHATIIPPEIPPKREEFTVHSANFSPDGMRIVTTNIDTAWIWETRSLFRLPAETPQWVREWSCAVAGSTFDADGVMQVIPSVERLRILSMPHEGDDPWSKLARWLATDPSKRTTHPDSPHTCREIAERERDFGSKESLESALRYDTSVPLARLMLAKFEENPQRAAFLRDYDLKRLPDDPALWVRAAQSLHEQKDDPRARQALQKLEKLAPEKASALRKEPGW